MLILLLPILSFSVPPAALQSQGWLQFRHDAGHSGRTKMPGPPSGTVAWTAPLPNQRSVNLECSVGPDGVIYVGTWGGGTANFFNGRLYAFNPDGTERWVFEPGPPDQPSQNQHPIWGTIEGSPVIDLARNRLYFGRGDNKLWCIDRDGQYLWEFATYPPGLPEQGGQVISPPCQGPDGTIYFGTVPYTTRARTTVFAVTPDGVERWRHEFAGSDGIWASPALAPDGTLYVTSWEDQGAAHAFRELTPGVPTLLWTWRTPRTGGPDYVFHPTVAPDGGVYVAGGRSAGFCDTRAFIAALTPGGQQRWYWEASTALEDITYEVALDADGALVFGTASTQQQWPLCVGVADRGRLYRATDAGGALQVQWRRNFGGAVMGVAIARGGNVYATVRGDDTANVPGRVAATDRNGNDLWAAPVSVNGEIWWCPPAIGPGERLYVGTNPCADVLNVLPCPEDPELVAIGPP